jgi:hypothetical protein
MNEWLCEMRKKQLSLSPKYSYTYNCESHVCNMLTATDQIILVQYISSLYEVVPIILRIYLLDFCPTDGAAFRVTSNRPWVCSSLKWIGPLRRDKWVTIKSVSESTSRLRCGRAKFKKDEHKLQIRSVRNDAQFWGRSRSSMNCLGEHMWKDLKRMRIVNMRCQSNSTK